MSKKEEEENKYNAADVKKKEIQCWTLGTTQNICTSES
jgi:hypothetical protein